MSRNLMLVVGILITLASLFMLLWGMWPPASKSQFLPILPSDWQIPQSPSAQTGNNPNSDQTVTPSPQSSNSDNFQLSLSWPAEIRVSDSETIRLALEPTGLNSVETTVTADPNSQSDERKSSSRFFEAYQIIAQARLEMSGMEFKPSGEISEALLPGQPVRFAWSVRPAKSGQYQGAIWLHLKFIPRAGGDAVRKVITAQVIPIKARKFLGLNGSTARILGIIGLVLGCVMILEGIFPFKAKNIIKRNQGELENSQERNQNAGD